MSRNPGINNLINENSGSMATGLVALDAMRQRYRDKRQADIAEKERVLTAKFWPLVYNNSDMEHHTLEAWLASNAPDLGATLHETQGQALEYLWARMAFVSESFSNLYWFTFWDGKSCPFMISSSTKKLSCSLLSLFIDQICGHRTTK
jgi:hypothetical protein